MGLKDTDPETVRIGYRANLKIAPNSRDGMLLAYLHKTGETDPGKNNPRPGKLTDVGADNIVKNDTNDPRTLWLVINDAVLREHDDDSRMAFLDVENEEGENLKAITARPQGYTTQDLREPKSWTRVERWNSIQESQYWNAWFDDNIGFFQIQVDYNSDKKGNK